MKYSTDTNLNKLINTLLNEVLKFKSPTDKLLSEFFRHNRQLKSNERETVAETVYSTIRNMELPQWIYDKLATQMPKIQMQQLVEAMKSQAPLTLRVNSLKTNRQKIMTELAKFNPLECKFSPYGITLNDRAFLSKHKVFTEGLIEVQDEASQLAGLLLNPKRGEMVVDFCAGAGGKTLLLGMLMRNSGRIYAFDVNQKRLSNLTPRLARSGLSNVYPQLIQNENDSKVKRLQGKIDKVFVDAPCSGLGTLRRSPELKFRQTENAINELNIKQLSILNSAAKLLKVGGMLIYATCSILKEENEDIVEKFLAENTNFKLVPASGILDNPALANTTGYLHLLPHKHTTDGFFAALMQRVS
ncbi:MAG: SAM-dependent methyltransferase [Burkholderiales bacterium]|jgi:16S rRNA (cytosine967-C5)-methyltransferase|nr:SAM-dependent methyltransferase [Burkholderiales bacterium]